MPQPDHDAQLREIGGMEQASDHGDQGVGGSPPLAPLAMRFQAFADALGANGLDAWSPEMGQDGGTPVLPDISGVPLGGLQQVSCPHPADAHAGEPLVHTPFRAGGRFRSGSTGGSPFRTSPGSSFEEPDASATTATVPPPPPSWGGGRVLLNRSWAPVCWMEKEQNGYFHICCVAGRGNLFHCFSGRDARVRRKLVSFLFPVMTFLWHIRVAYCCYCHQVPFFWPLVHNGCAHSRAKNLGRPLFEHWRRCSGADQ